MQKHRRTRWIGRLLVALSLLASWGAQAALDTVAPIPPLYWRTITSPGDWNIDYTSAEAACSSYRIPLEHFKITTDGYNQPGTFSVVDCYYPSDAYTYAGAMSYMKCPAPKVPPLYIPYSLNWGTGMCERIVWYSYTITLSGGTSVEPWHKKADADHKKANLQYTATVMDTSKQPAQPAPNVEVTITTDVTQDSGGHVHVDGRHKGKLAIPSDPIKDGKETITGSTDINGVYSFVFGSEEASGTHTLTAKCSTGCEAPATATVKVEIKGLSLLDGDPLSYTLNGETTTHPGSHYFSAAAMTKIINLAHKYSHDPAFNKQLLIINDSSLIKGGVFDLGQDWTYEDNGHQGHRIGVVVDVNNYRDGPNQKFKKFAKDCCEIDAVWEGPDVTSTPHYHLRLLGKDQ